MGGEVIGKEGAGMAGMTGLVTRFFSWGSTGAPGSENGGAVGSIGNLIASMYSSPPSSSGEYLAYLKSNLGLAEPAYAQQGTGWQALSPILDVWKAFRNVAYLGFVVVFIVIGFMIMFRAKIDAQTVITVQAALPKIVITLLVITFSYAIAGLMIDLIYIAIYLFVGVFSLSGLISDSSSVIGKILDQNLWQIIWKGKLFKVAPGMAIDSIIRDMLGKETFGKALVAIGGNVLFSAVLRFALFFVIFKLFITLLLCFK